MRLSIVLLAVMAMGCGGGGDGYPTENGGSGSGSGSGSGAGGGTGNATSSATVSVQQSDDGYGTATFAFSPASVSITRGGTVTWSNDAATAAHNVTFSATAGVPANIGSFASGSQSRTFNTSGAYAYQCTNHAGMSGQVNVQ